MKKNSNLKIKITNSIFIIITGFILHFCFKWSNNSYLIGSFSAVNESIWEHLKILFFPMLITTIIEYLYFQKNQSNYICIKTKGILLSLTFIIIFHYTYSGILGTHIALIDIGSFIIATILEEYYTYKNINQNSCNNKIHIIILIILSISFITFTYYPPHIGIFKDPITGLFGIKKLP